MEELNKKIVGLLQENNKLKSANEVLSDKSQKEIDSVFREMLTVVDSFDDAEAVIKERGLDRSDDAQRAVTRLLSAKRKLVKILEKNDVTIIEFPDGLANDNDCLITDTVPDKGKRENEIVSIEKNGYYRKGHLLRPAEVIVVKN